MSLNRITLIGNVGHDPELRYTPKSRQPLVNLSLVLCPINKFTKMLEFIED